MKSIQAIAPFLAGAVAALPELTLVKRDANLEATVQARGVYKRSGTLSTSVFDVLTWSTGGAYYANVTVGTPPQNQVVILDTGSSDLYFDASNAPSCLTTGEYSCRGGTYNYKNSKTYKVAAPSPAFNTSFGDGSTAVGPFLLDTVAIGSVSIANVQFGVAEKVNSTTGYAIGLMGVGYSLNEATETKYPNMPEVLAQAGVIASRLYSVFLNSVGQISGSILFGGIDTSKYTGNLVTVNIIPDPDYDAIFEFITSVTALTTNVNGKTTHIFSGGSAGVNAFSSSGGALPVLLDTGSSAWSVPYSVYTRYIQPRFPYVDKDGLCSCSHRNNADSITLEFARAINITVPATEFIVPLYDPSTNKIEKYSDGSDACVFMISAADPRDQSAFQTLGDSILRSMYVVFDLDNAQLSIAQAAVNSTAKPNVIAVGAGPNGLASALGSAYTPIVANSYSIVGPVSASSAFVASTLATPVGTATGSAAVPADAQPGSGKETTAAGATGSGAASGLTVPSMDFTAIYVSGMALFMAALGAGIML